MNDLKTYIVDAFTNEPFRGNPAGVCIANTEIQEDLMLSVAKELGLSETAFITQKNKNSFEIRFFSPVMEIPLCGHATLASSKVVFELNPGLKTISFTTARGIDLKVTNLQDGILMKLPLYETQKSSVPKELLKAIGITRVENVEFNIETKILLIEIKDCEELRLLQPDFDSLKRSHNSINGVLITSKSKRAGFDFESRYFWPWSGTNEDPVTGGTHTFLTPYWSKRLNKKKMKSFQCSERSGQMEVEIVDDFSISINSTARIVLEGNLRV